MDSSSDINALTKQALKLDCSEITDINDPVLTNEFTILARVFSDKYINMGALKSTLIKAWSPKKRVVANSIQPNWMAFIFESKEDVDKVLNFSWTFRDLQVIIQEWPDDKAFHEINMNITTFWIQAFGIPVRFTNLQTAQQIGNCVGKFTKADLNISSQKWKKSLRIQVQIDILKPLTSTVLLDCLGRPKFLIEIRYERLSDFCYQCGFLGHKIQSCNANGKVNLEISTCSFGPWLKAENQHISNPAFKNIIPPQVSSYPQPDNQTSSHHLQEPGINELPEINHTICTGLLNTLPMEENSSSFQKSLPELNSDVSNANWPKAMPIPAKKLISVPTIIHSDISHTISEIKSLTLIEPSPHSDNSSLNHSKEDSQSKKPTSLSLESMPGVDQLLGMGPKIPFGLKAPCWEILMGQKNNKRGLDLPSDCTKYNSIPFSSNPQTAPNSQPFNLISDQGNLISDFSPISEGIQENKKQRLENSHFTLQCPNSSTSQPFHQTYAFNQEFNLVNDVDISISTNAMQYTRNKIYTLQRSENGTPFICRDAKTSSVVITEINEDFPSPQNTPQNKPTDIDDPEGSLE